MKQNNHNTHFYSIQEVERCLKSTEDFEDGEQLFYFIGALRYVYDENKKKDKEIERLNNIINDLEKDIKSEIERTESLIEDDYSHGLGSFGEIRRMLNDTRKSILFRLKKLKESGNNE